MAKFPDPTSAWRAVLGRLQLEMPPAHFNTFLQPCVGHAWEEGRLVVAAGSSFVVSWLELPLHYAMAQEALAKTLGCAASEASIEYRALPGVAAAGSGSGGNPGVNAAAPALIGAAAVATPARAPIPADYDLGGRNSSRAGGGYDWQSANAATCNAGYHFDNFVVGCSNQLAYYAARAVAESAGAAGAASDTIGSDKSDKTGGVGGGGSDVGGYNPLLLYAGPGLGKTHLLHAIGNRALQQGRAVLYVTSEQFTNEFVSAVSKRTMRQFRDRYRSLDVLLLDDVQFLSGKEQTQESLFHTFNDLHQAGAQIVLTSDRAPQSINPLEERLRSRFQSGLLADIQPPSLETRLAILHGWAEARRIAMPAAVLELIAQRVSSNVRVLQGAFNRIVAAARLLNLPAMTPEQAAAELDAVAGPESARAEITAEQVLQQTARRYRIDRAQILGRSRTAAVAEARQVAMYLLTDELGSTPTDAGRILAGRNHSTVIHGAGKIRDALAEGDARIVRAVGAVKEALYA